MVSKGLFDRRAVFQVWNCLTGPFEQLLLIGPKNRCECGDYADIRWMGLVTLP